MKMKRKKACKPTDSELEILQILWEKGASSVRDVNDRLNENRKVGKSVSYTGTLKLMQIMTEKDLLERNTEQRSHIYIPKVKETEIQKDLLDTFVDATFRGAAMKMVMQALGNHEASKEELDEIKALIHKIEKDK